MTRSRTLTVLALLFVTGTTALAQGRITGTVHDSSGAVSGAEVSIQGVKKPATTGRAGEFDISNVPAGTVVINVRRIGYAPYSMIIVLTNGETKALDIPLIPVPRELDTVAVRDQQLLREYPLLREFEDNRKVGLGQFVTRAQLAKMQGGILTPVFNQMRGLIMVRSSTVPSHTWIASSYMPFFPATIPGDCFRLEDRLGNEGTSPVNAHCKYCFPQVYLDYTRLSTDRDIPNVGMFSPDQLQAIEVYGGPAETPPRYSGNRSSCGVIVLHSRAVERSQRRIARRPDDLPTRSRVFLSVGMSASAVTHGCEDCAYGGATDMMIGYTFKDRWVVGGRYAKSAVSGGAQVVTLRQAILEWYPHEEPARVKWFLNAGVGGTWLDLSTTGVDELGAGRTDTYQAHGLPSVVGGTGVDIGAYRRFVVTPFLSLDRTIGGRAGDYHCVVRPGGDMSANCGRITVAQAFSLTQLGVRFGWR
jgi:hypothetical protein